MIFSAKQLNPSLETDLLTQKSHISRPKVVSNSPWEMPPKKINISSGDIHLWQAHLDGRPDAISHYQRILSGSEQVRATKFKFEQDQRRFIMARGILRAILGLYLSTGAGKIDLEIGEYGKPRLKKEKNRPDLRFSLSHSEGIALYGFTLGHEVGVDLEFIKEDIDVLKIAEHMFPEKIKKNLYQLSANDRIPYFYASWTRIEAYLKANCFGLSIDPRQVNLPLRVDTPGDVVNLYRKIDMKERMSIYDLEPAPGFIGAVAAEGNDWQITRWSWNNFSEL
jgi:4'-phosphopantetheinyl transferase